MGEYLLLNDTAIFAVMSSTPFLQVISAGKFYDGDRQSGLRKTNLIIQQGQITAIIGESGSGKSTLLKLLYGVISPDEGELQFMGERIWGPQEKLIPGHDAMKMVTQDTDGLNVYAKVWENIAVLMPNTDVTAKTQRTAMVLEQLNMLHLSEKRVIDLSGGERQRVAIARALITQPDILLLDEPFNQVDASFREGLQHDIREIVKTTGLTVVMVSHDPAEVLSMADELVVLRKGEILEQGHPKKLYVSPRNLYTAKLLSNCNVLTKAEARRCDITSDAEFVVVYPESISIGNGWTTRDEWRITQVLFKGAYEDLIIERDSNMLRSINFKRGKYREGDMVNIKIERFL